MSSRIIKSCSFRNGDGSQTDSYYLIEETGLRLIRRRYRIEYSSGGPSRNHSFSNDYDQIMKDWQVIELQKKINDKAFSKFDRESSLFLSYDCLIRSCTSFLGLFNDREYYFYFGGYGHDYSVEDVKKGKFISTYPPSWFNTVDVIYDKSGFAIIFDNKCAKVEFKTRGKSKIIVDIINNPQEFESGICRSLVYHRPKPKELIDYIWD